MAGAQGWNLLLTNLGFHPCALTDQRECSIRTTNQLQRNRRYSIDEIDEHQDGTEARNGRLLRSYYSTHVLFCKRFMNILRSAWNI